MTFCVMTNSAFSVFVTDCSMRMTGFWLCTLVWWESSGIVFVSMENGAAAPPPPIIAMLLFPPDVFRGVSDAPPKDVALIRRFIRPAAELG